MFFIALILILAWAFFGLKIESYTSKETSVPSYGPFSLRIGESTCVKGQRGVFATVAFTKGDVVEKCPCVIVSSELSLGRFDDYTFEAGEGFQGLAFGYGCMYNHSKNPNVEFEYDSETNTKTYTALRDIQPGEELFSSYGSGWWKGRKGLATC